MNDRDVFAAHALSAILSRSNRTFIATDATYMAQLAYCFADAMMEARGHGDTAKSDAAPLMYEALRLVDGLLPMYLAVGQSYGDINRQWQFSTGDPYYEPNTKDAIERTRAALAKARGEV